MKSKIIKSVIVFLLISGCIVGYFVYQISNPVKVFDTESSDNTSASKTVKADATDSTEPEYDIDLSFMKGRVNILLLGMDLNEQRLNTMGAFRTDTMMLFSIDFINKKIAILSIPRDTYVKIPGRNAYNKINSAFAYGGGLKKDGFALTRETVTNFLGGIPVNYHVGLDMDVVEEIIDAMGGLELEVDVPVKLGGRELKPGKQKLTGQQVMDYSRWRYTRRGDIDRVGRQQRVIMAIFRQLFRTNQLKNIPQIYSIVREKIYTDLEFTHIATLAFFAKDLTMDDIKTYTISGDFLNIDGTSYWGAYERDKQRLVKEIFGVEIEINMHNDVYYVKQRVLREEQEKQKKLEEELKKQEQETEEDEQPGGEQPGDEKPVEEQPGREQPKDEQPNEEQPGGEQPKDEQPKDEQSGGEQPGDEKPVEEQPAGEQSNGGQPKDKQPVEEQTDKEQSGT
ncbi:MAG: LCP family protein [Mahellales bacterium]|jgi:LCP family protein required for cell wall assembly